MENQDNKNRINNLGISVADHVNAMLAYWDKDLVCRFANAGYRSWFGKSPEEMIDKITMKELLGPTIYQANLTYITSVLKGEPQTFEREIPVHGKPEKTRYTIVSYTPDIQNGAVLGFFVHVADVTQIKLLEKKLLLSNKIITTQNKRLLNFAHIASHNLRSPVGNLAILLDFYNNSINEEFKGNIFNKFKVVITHLTETLNELLAALKLQQEDEEATELLDFEELFIKTTELLSGQILETKALVTYDFSEVKSIEYPKSYLESILVNLLSNALKYRSLKRTPEIHFKTRITSNKKKIVLTASDNGLGIDLAKHENNMFRLNQTFHDNADAEGVGLFLTKTQVEAMGGEITLTTAVDKGTTFKITF